MLINTKASIILGSTLLSLVLLFSSIAANSNNNKVKQVTLNCQSTPDSLSDQPAMVWVPTGSFNMGAEIAYFEEGPVHQEHVSGFWMDTHEVSNQQFSEFVTATSYLTISEQGTTEQSIPESQRVPGSAVFMPLLDGEMNNPFEGWWRFLPGANWQHPEGPESNIVGREKHPVVHIAYEDALAYAKWKGHTLPTEEQFEYAAQSSARKDTQGDFQSNTWQGFFPFQNDPLDGFTGTSPVGCFNANDYGIYDLIGNVWEWTMSPYYSSHNFPEKENFPQGYDPLQPGEAVAVIKGGSYLCAPNFCMRYRPEARQGQSLGLGTSHIGFRTVLEDN